ncbi:phospholipase B1, membrane-associated-like, partial [Scleropages formosus]
EYPEKTRPVGFKHPPFQCPDMSPSPTVPTSVELVKAADIKAIAALGDSLTSIHSLKNARRLIVELQSTADTMNTGTMVKLPNVFRLFNPDLLGPAPKATLSGYPTTINDTGLNLAGLNFKEDWKLVSVLIGMNDVCDYCKNKTLFSADSFVKFMMDALDMLMNELPVCTDTLLPGTGAQTHREYGPDSAHGSPPGSEKTHPGLPAPERRLEQLIHSGRYFKEDFAVVLQPYLAKAQPARLQDGTIDLSFFTTDCFHFTIKGHEELAKGLWNNMVGITVLLVCSCQSTVHCSGSWKAPLSHPVPSERPDEEEDSQSGGLTDGVRKGHAADTDRFRARRHSKPGDLFGHTDFCASLQYREMRR